GVAPLRDTRCTAPWSGSATQAAPSPALTSVGKPATGMPVGTRLRGLPLFRVPAKESVTQICPAPALIESGRPPTGMRFAAGCAGGLGVFAVVVVAAPKPSAAEGFFLAR